MARERWLVGVDGGGSTIRVVVTASDLEVRGRTEGPAANPSAIGRAAAAEVIRRAVRTALDDAGLVPEAVAAAGIGVAGAAASHSADWLREVLVAVLPGARIVPSADYEIALVGAHGARRGVLALAGTGSLAYGINRRGRSALVGGWGYLLGDEGGGYWLGLHGLRAAIRADDGRGPATALATTLPERLGLAALRELIPWLYRDDAPRTHEVARLAELVLAAADQGDAVARDLVGQAADELALAVRTVAHDLRMRRPAIAFAGGLLGAENALSRALCARLDLPARPEPRYPPAIGAALLARLALESA